MTILALALVIIAAFVHATWNLLAKVAGGGVVFVWLFGSLAVVLYAPFAIPAFLRSGLELTPTVVLFLLGSSMIHMGYFLSLQRGYRAADFSVVYPTARSTGVFLAGVLATVIYGERPSLLAVIGASLIITGVILLSADFHKFRSSEAKEGIWRGLVTGLFIASYTLWDKYAVSSLSVPPLFFDWTSHLGRVLILAPFALYHRESVVGHFRSAWKYVLGVAILCPLAYILILTAMVFTPVTYIAPAREVSIVIGAFLGVRFLGEAHSRRRLVSAGIMALGMVALAVG